MANENPQLETENGQLTSVEAAKAAEIAAEMALVPTTHEAEDGEGAIPLNAVLARLPVELDVSIPVPDFRVRNLLSLAPGQVVESDWGHGEDMPLSAGNVQLAWSEFEVVETQLAIRMTRLV
jgi:flagellar motor switch/type III secretory pathway protein FliN